jgi:hypothetical protein
MLWSASIGTATLFDEMGLSLSMASPLLTSNRRCSATNDCITRIPTYRSDCTCCIRSRCVIKPGDYIWGTISLRLSMCEPVTGCGKTRCTHTTPLICDRRGDGPNNLRMLNKAKLLTRPSLPRQPLRPGTRLAPSEAAAPRLTLVSQSLAAMRERCWRNFSASC